MRKSILVLLLLLFPASLLWAGDYHLVRSGHTVTAICQRYGLSRWDLTVFNLSNNQINLNNLQPGDKVRVTRPTRYRVKSGDTLGRIAQQHGMDLVRLRYINGMSRKANYVQVGSWIKVEYKTQGSGGRSGGTYVSKAPARSAKKVVYKKTVAKKSKGVTYRRAAAPKASPKKQYARKTDDPWIPSITPLYRRISSGYGWRRHPVTGKRRSFHTGVDIRGGYGTSIRATASGTVTYTGFRKREGYMIVIKHKYGYSTKYLHLSKKFLVKRGQTVKRGQYIGYIGASGRRTGPHVHYGVYKWGRHTNPKAFIPRSVWRDMGGGR